MYQRSIAWTHVIPRLLGVLLLVAGLLIAGCGSSGPAPDESLKQLGAQVGDAAQDKVDFPALLKEYATDRYAGDGEPGFVKYRLFMAGKAADVALNQGKTDVVKVEQDVSGDTATVTMVVQKKEGIFSVAPVGKIALTMQKVQGTGGEVRWSIDQIALTP